MLIDYVGSGKVKLISGGGKIFTDIAARFVGSNNNMDEIIGSDYDKNIVANIINSNHLACAEFDYFIFAVEGFSRVTETQLVRKRLANYMIKSGRINKKGKREFSVVLPQEIITHSIDFKGEKWNVYDILELIRLWYDEGVKLGIAEEELRYLKPQATEFKGLIGMNAHALIDWFKIRCCRNAQFEIANLAMQMLKECRAVAPDLFALAGASCMHYGYCPENKRQHKDCVGKILTKDKALLILDKHKNKA